MKKKNITLYLNASPQRQKYNIGKGTLVLHTEECPKKHIDHNGFTLLEVMIAVVILGLSYVAILQNFSFSAQNIVRIEKSRSGNLEDFLTFEKHLRELDEEDTGLGDAGEVFLEGNKFKLVVIESESGNLKTLKLQKIFD